MASNTQTGETLGAILVTQPLTKDNYPTWARTMRMALDAKSKLGPSATQ